MQNNEKKIAVGLSLALIALAVTSDPRCRAACQNFFQPIATGGGQLAFAGIVGLLGAAIA
jgi:hypothetical protein